MLTLCFVSFKLVNGSVSKAAAGMAEVPGTSSETITETVQTSTPPPPQQVNHGQLFVRQVDWQPVTVSIKDTAFMLLRGKLREA